MALKTLGTNATTSLTAYQQSPGGLSVGSGIDAQMRNSIKNDVINKNPLWPGPLGAKIDGNNNRIYIPNRGHITILPGDWIAIDSTGWPILLSKNAVANAAWTKLQISGDSYSMGTTLTTSLNAFNQNSATLAQTDLGNLNNAIKNDLVNTTPIWPTAYQAAFGQNGRLSVPNRGNLLVFAGDYVAYDSTGWPILVSANAIANGPWTHN